MFKSEKKLFEIAFINARKLFSRYYILEISVLLLLVVSTGRSIKLIRIPRES